MHELLRVASPSLRLITSSALFALMALEVAAAPLPVASLRLATGFGVDTTGSPARDVFHLWRWYLNEPSDSLRAHPVLPVGAGPVPRMTRTWRHETVGAISFVFPPSHEFDARRARATAAFADSLASAFGQPPPQPITFYFTSDLEDTFRALGLEFFPLGSDTIGGRSNVFVRHVYVGGAGGEANRHEIAHIVLAPEVSQRSAPLLMEGLMTWTGGAAGMSYSELLPGLARYVVAHPTLSLESVMEEPPPRVGTLDVGYDGMAVLCDLVHAKKDIDGVRTLMQAGRTSREVLGGAAHQLGVSRDALDTLWRKAILAHRR